MEKIIVKIIFIIRVPMRLKIQIHMEDVGVMSRPNGDVWTPSDPEPCTTDDSGTNHDYWIREPGPMFKEMWKLETHTRTGTSKVFKSSIIVFR